MSSQQMVTAVTIGGALVFGMSVALFGNLKLALTRRLQRDDGQVRRWLIALTVALAPLVLLCGILVDIYGPRPVLIAGSVALAVGLVSLSLRPRYPHAFLSVLLAGFGAVALSASVTVLMPRAFFAPPETSASINLGYVFVALGALLTPVLADILFGVLELRRALAVFALLALVPAFLAVFPDSASWQIADHPGDPTALLFTPAGWLAALVCFFYAPLEASISLWTFALLRERGQDRARSGRPVDRLLGRLRGLASAGGTGPTCGISVGVVGPLADRGAAAVGGGADRQPGGSKPFRPASRRPGPAGPDARPRLADASGPRLPPRRARRAGIDLRTRVRRWRAGQSVAVATGRHAQRRHHCRRPCVCQSSSRCS